MKPFVDRGIGLIERPSTIIIGAPEDDTIPFDQFRQGIEVTNVKYFLQSNIPYMSSKGIPRGSVNSTIDHELDYVNLGQGINLDGFSPFQEQNELKTAAEILIGNVVQSDEDPYYGKSAQDGEIDVFSDTGKRTLLLDRNNIKSRGIRGLLTSYGSLFSLNGSSKDYFLDAADSFLGIPAPGYGGNDISSDLFEDKIYMNTFGTEIDYTYVGPDGKSPTNGNDYYGSNSGTDSIAYGGFLR